MRSKMKAKGKWNWRLWAGVGIVRFNWDGEAVNRMGTLLVACRWCPFPRGLAKYRGGLQPSGGGLDITLSAVDGSYYDALRRYRAGYERNRLLKRGGSAAELSAFEAEMAPSASLIAERRSAAIQKDGFDAETNL